MNALYIEKILSYPRSVMRGAIETDFCPHGGELDADDPVCVKCIDADDCHWLQHNDLYADFEHRQVDELIAELDYARDYINAQVTFWGHHQTTCHCASCNWLREAQSFSDQQVTNS